MSELFSTDTKGLTPVIGIILITSITVVMAAIIGGFVVGLGAETEDQSPIPTTDFEPEIDGEKLVVTHQGGQGIEQGETLTLQVETEEGDVDTKTTIDGMTAGDTIETVIGDDLNLDVKDGDTITVNMVWEADRADVTGKVLEEHEFTLNIEDE